MSDLIKVSTGSGEAKTICLVSRAALDEFLRNGWTIVEEPTKEEERR